MKDSRKGPMGTHQAFEPNISILGGKKLKKKGSKKKGGKKG